MVATTIIIITTITQQVFKLHYPEYEVCTPVIAEPKATTPWSREASKLKVIKLRESKWHNMIRLSKQKEGLIIVKLGRPHNISFSKDSASDL